MQGELVTTSDIFLFFFSIILTLLVISLAFTARDKRRQYSELMQAIKDNRLYEHVYYEYMSQEGKYYGQCIARGVDTLGDQSWVNRLDDRPDINYPKPPQ